MMESGQWNRNKKWNVEKGSIKNWNPQIIHTIKKKIFMIQNQKKAKTRTTLDVINQALKG